MKILALSDIHSRIETLKKLLEKAKNKEIDLILVLGDLTNFGGKKEAIEVIKPIKKLNKKILAISGNLDRKEVVELLEKEGISLHSKKEEFKGIVFVGFGAGIYLTESVEPNEEKIYEKLKELSEKTENIFLVTHFPPKNSSIDKNHAGKHIGSKAVRKIIEEFSPEFSFSGHCHEAKGTEIIGKTFCVNTGAVKDGKMVLFDTKTKKLEGIEL